MQMFWGLVLEPGKKYEQKAESSFHLTMACLEPSNKTPTPNKPSITSVIYESNKTQFILCNLDQQRVLQQPLDCVFTEGEPISFSVNGDSKVHLSGYIMPDSDLEDSEDMFGLEESDDSDSEAELMNMSEKKRKLSESKDGNKKVKFGDESTAPVKADKKQEKAKPPAKGAKNDVQAKGGAKGKAALDEDDDDEEEDESSMDSEDMKDLLDNFEDDDEEDEEEEDDEDDESSPEVKKPPVKQQGKQNQKPTPAKQGGQPGKQDGQKNQTPQGKKPFQQGGQGGKPWSAGKGGKGGPQNNANKNQNSGKKGTPGKGGPNHVMGKGASPNKKPWGQKK